MKFTLILFWLLPLSGFIVAQTNDGYTISGKIKGLQDNIPFYLIRSGTNGRADTVRTTMSRNQKFEFKGFLRSTPEFYFVKIDTSKLPLKKQQRSWVRILLDNSLITLSGNINDWPEMEIEGSPLTLRYDKFSKKRSIILNEINEASSKGAFDSLKKQDAQTAYIQETLNYIKENTNDKINPLLIKENSLLTLQQVEHAYENFSDDVKNSFYGNQLMQHIINLKQKQQISTGKQIPDFQVETPDGDLVSVRDIAKESKLTLIDFWAYWCIPCRKDIPLMKKTYSHFKDLGFNILSISIDPNKPAWRKAMAEENTAWLNGLERDKVSKDVFGLASIPAYILLNSNAEILAMDMNLINEGGVNRQKFSIDGKTKGLRGDDLYEVIKELLDRKPSK